jgi:hypothetical protein
LAHGLVEGKAQNLDKEVDGVSSFVLLGPSPIGVFDKESFEGGQFEILGFPLDELESAFAQQGFEGGDAGGADLFARPS